MKPEIITDVTAMAAMSRERNFSPNTALVPTMGFLHEGHLDLVRHAARLADNVVVSIFVNPLQFGQGEDFESYPRGIERDADLLAGAGATFIFAPDASDMTPPGMTFSVDPGGAGERLCGKYRPGHFKGVCTIVLKLFNIVRPGIAVFGWKDAQQFLLLRKMILDLNMPIELLGMETRREPDGLAMSSRNSYLDENQRQGATAIYRGLADMQQAYRAGIEDSAALLKICRDVIQAESLLNLQYAEAVNMDTLEPVDKVVPGHTLVAVAAYAGRTRLIDNVRL